MYALSIGRSPENTIVIQDQKVSAKHLLLRIHPQGAVTVQDLNSTNGTFLNSRSIGTDEKVLQPGDRLQIGDTTLPWEDYLKKYPVNAQNPSGEEKAEEQEPVTSEQSPHIPSSEIQKKPGNTWWVPVIITLLSGLIILLLVWYFNYVVVPTLSVTNTEIIHQIIGF